MAAACRVMACSMTGCSEDSDATSAGPALPSTNSTARQAWTVTLRLTMSDIPRWRHAASRLDRRPRPPCDTQPPPDASRRGLRLRAL